jgi:hypothetical protein
MHVCAGFSVEPRTSARKRADNVHYLSEKKSREENTELVIIEGLSGMEDSDFKCWRHESGIKVEDGLSFNWAYRARVKFPNVFLNFPVDDQIRRYSTVLRAKCSDVRPLPFVMDCFMFVLTILMSNF